MVIGDLLISILKVHVSAFSCSYTSIVDVVFDQSPQFISKVWNRFVEPLKVKINLSLAYHHKYDGQTKCLNQTLEQYLHCTINFHQDDWVDLLSLAEFS